MPQTSQGTWHDDCPFGHGEYQGEECPTCAEKGVIMSEPTIITNGHHRDVIDAWELTDDERKDFDYLDWSAIQEGQESRSFVRYKGELYDLDDLERVASYLFEGWDGYVSETFFSGVLFKYVDDFEGVVVGRYYA